MDIVKYLVETAQCSVNETSADGSTALLLAAMCNHAEIAQYLISNGAKPGIDYSRVCLTCHAYLVHLLYLVRCTASKYWCSLLRLYHQFVINSSVFIHTYISWTSNSTNFHQSNF